MKNIYNFVYCIDNTEDFLLDTKQLNKKEVIVNKFLENIEFAPSKTVVDKILDYAKIA